MIDLKNLNIILTGSTGVIGNSIIEQLHSSNANIIATGTNENKLKVSGNKKELITRLLINNINI